MRVDVGAHGEILRVTRFRERAAMLCILEEAIEPISIPFVDEAAGFCRVVETYVREPLDDTACEPARARRVLQRELTIAPSAHDGHIRSAAGGRTDHRRHRRIVD